MNDINCNIHSVPFKHYDKNGKDWWAHSYPDGQGGTSWCNYKEGDQKRAVNTTSAYIPALTTRTYGTDQAERVDRERRIQRQHCHEMALRYLDLLQKTDDRSDTVSLKEVFEITDHFMEDLQPKN